MAKHDDDKKRETGSFDPDRDKIRPDDIKRSLNRLQGEVDSQVEATIPLGVVLGVTLAVVIVAGVFLAGLRRGKRETTLIEVRRF